MVCVPWRIAMTWLGAPGLVTVMMTLLHISAGTESCIITQLSDDPSTLDINCRGQNLSELPTNLYSKYVVHLDISRNNFQSLPPLAFKGLSNLIKLNVSQSGIKSMSKSAFRGLDKLEELDIKNNPVLGDSTGVLLPGGVFNSLIRLTQLSISGPILQVMNISFLGELTNLKEIIISPSGDYMPYQLEKLPNIISVYFVFGKLNHNGTLHRKYVHPLHESNIRELAYISCDLTNLEHQTFDGFSNLSVLNFGGNHNLNLDKVIDALSGSVNVSVTTLILDQVGSSNHITILGLHELAGGACRSAWNHIQNLSIRGTNIVAILTDFKNCLPNLRALAAGFNTIFKCGTQQVDCLLICTQLMKDITYIDLSYLMVNDNEGLRILSGYNDNMNWIKRNMEYFPKFDSTIDMYPCSIEISRECERGVNCVVLPQCLTHLEISHIFMSLFYRAGNTPVVFIGNHLRYVNASNRLTAPGFPLIIRKEVEGLSHLEVFDISGFGMGYLNFSQFEQASQTLQILKLARNFFGQRPLSPFPELKTLNDLDMSDNYIKNVPVDMFDGLISIRHLNLAHNNLVELVFRLPLTLKDLDLSGNQLIMLDGSATSALRAHPSITLNIVENPFQCDCPEVEYLTWFQTTTAHIKYKEDIMCRHGSDDRSMINIKTSHMRLRCGLTINTVVISSVSCSIVVILLITCSLMYKYRWVIKWHFYKLRYLRKKKDDIILEIPNNGAMYSTFIVYPSEDDSTLNWVTKVLIPKVETEFQKPNLFMMGRNDTGGETRLDEIVRGVLQSQTAIWIICPAFLEDRYCEIAANLALHELGAKNNMMVIMENELTMYRVPRHFASLMHPSVGIPRLRYTDNEEGRCLFWAKLEAFLPAWATEDLQY